MLPHRSILLTALVLGLTLGAITLSASTVTAQTLTLQGLLALNAEGEYDSVVVDEGDEIDGGKEDLEDNLGADIRLSFGDSVLFGLRGGVLTADGEDSEASYTAYEGGGVVSVILPTQGIDFYLLGGGGATFLTAETEEDGEEMELDGVGFHVMGGAGLVVPMKGKTSFTAGVIYHRLSVDKLEGEFDTGEGEQVDITLKELVSERVLVTAGLQFDL